MSETLKADRSAQELEIANKLADAMLAMADAFNKCADQFERLVDSLQEDEQ